VYACRDDYLRLLVVVVVVVVDQMSSTDTLITHTYTYDGRDAYGTYTINVRGFNVANNDTRTAQVEVLEWPCTGEVEVLD